MMMLVLLAVPFILQAQTKFHDVEANEAKGPVKSITNSLMGQTQTINFTPEGKMQMDGVTDPVYDADGFLQSYSMKSEVMQMSIKYTWENGRVKSQSISMMGQTVTTDATYDDKGCVASQSMNMGGQQMNSTFSEYKLDDHGNWISRKAKMMGRDIEQTRTIEYYE